MRARLKKIRKRLVRAVRPPIDDRPGQLIRLWPDGLPTGRLLMSYSPQVYLRLREGKAFDRSHVSAWQNFNVARIFLDLGFQVDVVDFAEHAPVTGRDYDVVVDIMSRMGELSDQMIRKPVKILLPMFAHWTMHNSRTYQRHLALAHRRGVSIPPRRLVEPNDSVERSDIVLCKGGEFGRSTYAFSETRVAKITQLKPAAIDEFIDRDIERCASRFVWMGGSGAIHKGLDLVLEAFSRLPQLHLTVLGAVSVDKPFADEYARELNELPNVELEGWTDTLSSRYREIVQNAIGMIVPSASEISCGSVIAGMMTGMVPITTRSTDIDVTGIGYDIGDDSVDAVVSALQAISTESTATLLELSRASWTAANERYGRDFFLQSMRDAVCEVLGVARPSLWEADSESIRVPRIEVI